MSRELLLQQEGVIRRAHKEQKGIDVRFEVPSYVPMQLRGQFSLLMRSMRLQPSENSVVIPSTLSLQDYLAMVKVVETYKKRSEYAINRKNQGKREAEVEEEVVKTKKRKVILDESDCCVCHKNRVANANWTKPGLAKQMKGSPNSVTSQYGYTAYLGKKHNAYQKRKAKSRHLQDNWGSHWKRMDHEE